MKLIIAEKPSVALAIAKALNIKGSRDGYIENGEYIISWCVGHLVAAAFPEEYDAKYSKWNYADLPIIPDNFKYKIYGDKQKQFKVVKSLMSRKDVSEIINACDAGREGELIFRLVYNMANCKKPIKRLWISSMENAAIREGFENLKDGGEYDNLYHSALCRMWADWIVGINATRLFSILYGKTLNIGRVQTPTLALLCDRHNKIAFFRKEKYFTVELTLGGVKAETERLDNENTAKEIITACEHSQAVCISVTKETKTEQPPKLFDLTTLQRATNRIYGYTAKQTLDYAQALYEKKLITYPRTDSRYLTEDMAETAAAVIRLGADIPPFDKAPDFFPEISRMINNSKVSDHHAIIPTLEIEKADLSAIPTGELNILKLVLCRIISASAESYVYENTMVVFECGGYTFTAKGKEIVSEGFRTIEKLIYPKTDNAESAPLVKFYKGQLFAGAAPELKEKYTQPPKPYTEDTLLSAMETAGAKETADNAFSGHPAQAGLCGDKEEQRNKANVRQTEDEAECSLFRRGLGTPATRAAILEKLVQTGFVQRNGRQITPTKNGILLVSVLPDTLISAQLTAEWENKLAEIAKGKSSPKEFMQGIKSMITELTQRYREFDSARENPFKPEAKNNSLEV